MIRGQQADGSLDGDNARCLESGGLDPRREEGDRSSGVTRSLPRGVNLADVTEPGQSTGEAEASFFIRLMPVPIKCSSSAQS